MGNPGAPIRDTPVPKPLSRNRALLVAALLILTIIHRWHGLADYPAVHQTDDELHYIWAGLSLLEEGRPVSWSFLQGYDKKNAVLGKAGGKMSDYYIVRPALDHPPLFSLAVAGFARLVRAVSPPRPPEAEGIIPIPEVNVARVRLLTLLLYAAAALLLFDLARAYFSFGVACLTLALYGFIEHVVCHNRLLVTENLTTPLFLATLCVTQRYLSGSCPRRVFGIAVVFASAAVILCKVIAVSQPAAVVFLLLMAGKRQNVIYPILGALLGSALYLLYGWWQGWEVFQTIMAIQARRFDGFDSFLTILLHPKIVDTPSFSYLLFLGHLALFALVFSRRPPPILAAPLAYLLVFTFFTISSRIYGWHLLPFYPFLCMALAAVTCAAYRQASPMRFLGMTVLLLPPLFGMIHSNNDFHRGAVRPLYLLTLGVLAVLVFSGGRLRQRAVRYCIIIALAEMLLSEFWSVWSHATP